MKSSEEVDGPTPAFVTASSVRAASLPLVSQRIEKMRENSRSSGRSRQMPSPQLARFPMRMSGGAAGTPDAGFSNRLTSSKKEL
jgi:hypothetical protein